MLERHPRVNLYYASAPSDLSEADTIILPGSKSTIDDLLTLRRTGMAAAVLAEHRRGKRILGICGGYQMLGRSIEDPKGVEGEQQSIPGLGLLPIATVLTQEKTTRQVDFKFMDSQELCQGYEIHMGQSTPIEAVEPLNHFADGSPEGVISPTGCMGSYIHGLLDNEAVLKYILQPFEAGEAQTEDFDYQAYRQQQYDYLAQELRRHLDIPLIYNIMKKL